MAKAEYDCVTRPAGRPVRLAGLAIAALAGAIGAAPAGAASYAAASVAVEQARDGAGITDFYAARGGRPLWLAPGQGEAVQALMALLDSAELDGIAVDNLRRKQLSRALRASRGSPSAAIRADMLLSDSFVRYVRALRTIDPAAAGWAINDRELAPRVPTARAALEAAAAASGGLAAYVDRMGWMHATYADLRRALARAEMRGDAAQAKLLRANMLRTRLLPGEGSGRYVLVNTAAQRLYMVENDQVVDWMKVVVGKPAQPTPMMAAMIRYTAVNPYWNVPPDLAAERIAPNVVKDGLGYLAAKGYTVLSDWTDKAARVSPASIDWDKVASGEVQVRMRQNPGPANAMGRMKFMFPNPAGVYLHDTPNKELLNEDARLFSGGCVRLEAAPRLAKWLYGKPLVIKGAKPEQRVDLPAPVPVYLAYLTAVPQGSTVVYFDDVYHRDQTALASIAAR